MSQSDRRPDDDNDNEYMSGYKKLKTAPEGPRQGQALLNSISDIMNLNLVADTGLEEEQEHNMDGGEGSITLEREADSNDFGETEMEFEKLGPVVSDPPIEYDGFEQLPDRLPIVVKDKVTRTLKIKSRGKKKVASAMEEEAAPNTFNVIVYKGVVEENKPEVVERHFAMLCPGLYIRVEELKARLEGNYAARYKIDWETDEKFKRAFTLWNSRGGYKGISIPWGTLIRSGVKEGMDDEEKEKATEKRFIRQHDYWKRVAERAESPPKQPHNIVARYWDLPGPDPVERNNILLRFEASREVNKAVLNVLLPQALEKCHCRPNCTVVEPGKGDEPSPGSNVRWVLIGKHLLNLYKLYASRETMVILHNVGQRQETRPFPTAEQAKKADDELFRKLKPQTPRPRAKLTETSMTQHKVSAVVGEERGKGQAAVMNNVSATRFAELFKWPPNADGTRENQAEWLHRSAFSFGGMNETASKLSSQSINNLIFGTKEANTFMIHPESTIKNITALEFKRLQALKPESKKPTRAARKAKITGTISTKFGYRHYEEGDEPRIQMAVNVRTDPEPTGTEAEAETEDMEETADAEVEDKNMVSKSEMATESTSQEAKHNPKWMKTHKYPWLAPQLDYEFQIELSQLNRSMNAKLIIEPFSRVIPMRLEAELDKLVEEHVFGVKDLPTNIKIDAPQPKSPSRKRAGSWTTASVGRYGTGTKVADDPLSKLPFTPAYKEQKGKKK